MITNQTNTLIPNHSFGHNLTFKSPSEPIFDICISKKIQWPKDCPIWTPFIIYVFVPNIQDTQRQPLQNIKTDSPTLLEVCLSLETLS
jgi:hypothetical protein